MTTKSTTQVKQLRTLLAREVRAAEDRFARSETDLTKAQSEREAAEAELIAVRKKFEEFLKLFPEQDGEQLEEVEVATPVRRRRSSGLSLNEAMAKVMGDQVMRAAEVEEALRAAGLLPASNNPRSYIGTALSSSTVRLSNGEKVKCFIAVSRGQYMTREAYEAENRKPFEGSIASGSAGVVATLEGGTEATADDVLAQQGLPTL